MEAGSARTGSHRTRTSRDRELEFARVLAFSDGVFAIAITLLVLQLEVPESADDLGRALRDQLPDLFAFALSFAVLGKIWWAFHHRLFSSLSAFDGRLITINFLYLALAVLVPFSSELIGDYGDDREAVIVYAANLGLLSLVGALMVRYAWRHGLMEQEAAGGAGLDAGGGAYAIAAVFLASIPVALVSPDAATLLWLASFLGGRRLKGVAHRVERGRRD
jgi:uncharacterized membrane protein